MGLTTNFCARDIGVALQAWTADTDALVSFRLALCSAPTNGERTRVHTFVGFACLVIRTVLISLALY